MKKVLVVDDQVLFRKALASLLGSAGWEIVGEAANGAEAVEKTRELAPDLVLMDIRMPGVNGLEATRLIKAESPETKVVILTVSDEDEDLYQALRTGANGYLLKDTRPELLFELLQGVFLGEIALTPAIATRMLDEFLQLTERKRNAQSAGLTGREQEILELVVRGESNKGIAEALHIAEGTVKNHLHHILEKLHLRSRAQLVSRALRDKLGPAREQS